MCETKPTPDYSFTAVKKRLFECVRQNKREKVIAAIQEYGTSNLYALKARHLEAFGQKLDAILAEPLEMPEYTAFMDACKIRPEGLPNVQTLRYMFDAGVAFGRKC